MDAVSYHVANIIQSYDNREGINVTDKGDMVYVDLTRQFPSPGYLVIISRVMKDNDKLKIYFIVQPPAPDRVLPQILTYKTITVKIPRDELGDPPYKVQAVEMKMA